MIGDEHFFRPANLLDQLLKELFFLALTNLNSKTMSFQSIEYVVPSHWLSAIVNGDETSFDCYDDPKDYRAYKAFCKLEVKDAIVEVVSEEPYFSRSHDAEAYGVLPCCVVDCIFHFPLTKQLELL